jgi:hypothetical protein
MARANRVFISYRRDDALDIAGRIRDWLIKTQRIPRDDVFMDVTTILPGADFLQVIEQAIDKCRAMIIVISPSWLAQVNDPDVSYVRAEAETAVRHNLLIIPVLVGGAQMPTADQLPESLRPLTRRNIRALRSADFDYDMEWVRRGLGIGRRLSMSWTAAIAALLLVVLGAGLLSQAPQGNPVYQAFHPATSNTPTSNTATSNTATSNTATPTFTTGPTATTGPTGQVVAVDDVNPSITYTGDWTSLQGSDRVVYDNSTAHTTTSAGASFSYTFKGTAITLIATKGVDYGHTAFSIDGAAVATINFYADSQQNQVSVPIATGLAFATHTIMGVVVDGRLTVDSFSISE